MTAAGGERAALVEAVMPFLDEWQVLLKDIRQLTPDRVGAMLDRAERLRQQADAAGQGAIVHHVGVCIELLNAPGFDRRAFQETLRNLSEVTWQLKQEVGAVPRRGSSARPEPGPASMARPPLLSDLGASPPHAARGSGSPSVIEPPPPISLPGRPPPGGAALGSSLGARGAVNAPPALDLSLRSVNVGAAASPPMAAPPPKAVPPPKAAPPVAAPPPLSAPPKAAPPPLGSLSLGRRSEARGASPVAGSGPPAISPPGGPPFASAPPILSGRSSAAQNSPGHDPGARPFPVQKGKDKPNLMVATMFGLRAFGRGKGSRPPAGAAPGPSAPPAPAQGMLGLGRRSGREPSEAPRWIGPREGGLPELATRGPEGEAAVGAPRDLDERLRKLRSGDDSEGEREPPAERRSARPSKAAESDRLRSGSSGSMRRGSGSSSGELRDSRFTARPSRREGSFAVPWWIGGLALALIGLIVVVVLVFGRSSPSAPDRRAPAPGSAAADTELPTSRLLDDKERMKALISLVHSHGGGESPELADLVNEEAALVYSVLEQGCTQTAEKCERPVPMVAGTVRSGATPQHVMYHLFEDRKIDAKRRSSGQVPKWLAGLSTPAIGVEDDPNVRRWVEYYTTNQVGREEFQNMLFRCGAYQDLIENTLVHYGLPRALLALVMTESTCVPHAESPVGARGLWQFMPATARAYHLAVKENVVDERISPPKSTEAAVKFISDLYRKMGSWELALASYNMGPFGVAARIRRAGGDVSFWDLAAAGYLPEETARYVPRIQAYALILENLARFNFSTAQKRTSEATAELEAPPGTRLGLVARAASTSLDHLKLLNPDIVGTSVPDLPGLRFMVQVPKEDVFRARSVLDQLLADGDTSDRCVSSAFDWGSELFTEKMCGPPNKGRRRD